jgi:5-oxoprolinase (ATP-hydrolysing)
MWAARVCVPAGPLPEPAAVVQAYFEEGGRQATPAYLLPALAGGHAVRGPALLIDAISTVVVEPGATAHVTPDHNVRIELAAASAAGRQRAAGQDSAGSEAEAEADPIQLAIFSHRFMGIAEQMGRTLQVG